MFSKLRETKKGQFIVLATVYITLVTILVTFFKMDTSFAMFSVGAVTGLGVTGVGVQGAIDHKNGNGK